MNQINYKDFKIELVDNLDADKKLNLLNSYQKVFGEVNIEKFNSKIKCHNNFLFILVYDKEKVIAFKIGFAQDSEIFYSWIGGVEEEYRKNGLASKLMELQHQWCQNNGFSIIETRTMDKFFNMLSLNLKYGFKIIGTFIDYKKQTKIILNKYL
ncbi:MAG: GNAT family N-acetyltransferase [Candidatus Sericytochromatia bacterium]